MLQNHTRASYRPPGPGDQGIGCQTSPNNYKGLWFYEIPFMAPEGHGAQVLPDPDLGSKSIDPSIHQSIRPSIEPSITISVYLFINPFIFPSPSSLPLPPNSLSLSPSLSLSLPIPKCQYTIAPDRYQSCCCSWIFRLIYALSTSTTMLPPIFWNILKYHSNLSIYLLFFLSIYQSTSSIP